VSVARSVEGGVGWLRLDRPEKRNAITYEMRGALAEALAAFETDDGVRVLVLTGEGPAFCAGVDVSDAPQGDPSTTPRLTAPLDAFSKPAIAAVNGPAFGGGLELALACDIRIASSSATFAVPEVRIGSLPASGGVVRLRETAPGVAARMVLTGEPIDAAEALRTGLVSEVIEPDELVARAGALAATIAANAPLSLRAAKAVLRSGSIDHERESWAALAETEDRAEGRAAFREKRAPVFRGR
jgi:E-phenylitaconyl-CoA hydratase